MDKDIEEIKKHKLEQYTSQAQATQQEKLRDEYDAKKLAILRQILTPDARERINVLRMTKPELVTNIESQLIVLAQSGRLQKIDDAKLKSLLLQLQPKKREIQIRRI
jgi:programmed cell death protein 5